MCSVNPPGGCPDCDKDYADSLKDAADSGMPPPSDTARDTEEAAEAIIFNYVMEDGTDD